MLYIPGMAWSAFEGGHASIYLRKQTMRCGTTSMKSPSQRLMFKSKGRFNLGSLNCIASAAK